MGEKGFITSLQYLVKICANLKLMRVEAIGTVHASLIWGELHDNGTNFEHALTTINHL